MALMDYLKKALHGDFETSVTENGALGYRTTGSKLLDLNFSVSSMRNASEEEIADRFAKAFYEDRRLAVKWLFYAGDVREGMGERRLFRVCLRYLAENHPDTAKQVLSLVPEYGRWDHLICLLDTGLADEAVRLIADQLEEDRNHLEEGRPISLCAKWMPSVNASSKETKRHARMLAHRLGMPEPQYRKLLSRLRSYLNVVEVHMSSGHWEAIDYKAVPSRANLIYNKAFFKHDEERRQAFLEAVKHKKASIHAGVLYPHDIVHRYFEEVKGRYSFTLKQEDDTLEELWKALPDYVNQEGKEHDSLTCDPRKDTICVSDGSGSMMSRVGNTMMTCLEVANALSIYFAERCSGQFQNQYITFSANPQFVDLGKGHTLREKIEIARRYSEVANTNIEAVFELILAAAIEGRMKQSEMPAQILILSDMEFDIAAGCRSKISEHGVTLEKPDARLFEHLKKRYALAGYRLPRLVFWNICSRTGTIPVRENELGVALVSGFSVTTMRMVLSGETDPYLCLVEQLESSRYDLVEEALRV